MELSWLMKFRIAAAIATGTILIGFLAWPLAAPADPLGAVLTGNLSLGGKIALSGLAFFVGLLAYFFTWPYGRELGVLAVPAGLAVWAIRSGNMASLIQLNPAISHRQMLFASLRWEPIFWLAIVAIGFLGVMFGQKILSRPEPEKIQEKSGSKSSTYLNTIIALVTSGIIAQICIVIFAQDVTIFDSQLGSVLAQPAVGQIVFAVLLSFGIAAFVVKEFLNVGYAWPTVAGAAVTAFAMTVYARGDILQHLAQSWPAVFFPNAVAAILPVQMVAFATLGSIGGYWSAVNYNYWRKNQAK